MKTTLDIPDEVANQLQEHADRNGRQLAEQIVQVVKLGLIVDNIPVPVIEEMARALGSVSRQSTAIEARKIPHQPNAGLISVDPATGLLAIDSPPDAPIRFMTPQQVLAMTETALMEDELERAGISI